MRSTATLLNKYEVRTDESWELLFTVDGTAALLKVWDKNGDAILNIKLDTSEHGIEKDEFCMSYNVSRF